MSNNNTLSQQALLAALSFGMPRQSRQLKKEAKDVEDDSHAQAGVVKASVWYFQQKVGKITNDALFELKSHFNYWRKEHSRLTLPWQGDTRLLVAAICPQYFEMRSKMEEIAPVKLAEFLEVYDDWAITAPTRMGSLFSVEDFPSKSECQQRIKWETSLCPLGEVEQWKRIAAINPQHAAEEAAKQTEAENRAREEARMETWTSLIGHFSHITEVLANDKAKIHETLLGNLKQMLDLMPAYSTFFNDNDLITAANEAKETLATIDADDLRSNLEIRKTTLKNAEQLLAKFGSFGRKFA